MTQEKNRRLFELIARYAVAIMRSDGMWSDFGLPDTHWIRIRIEIHRAIRTIIKDIGAHFFYVDSQVLKIGQNIELSVIQEFHHETMDALKQTITLWYAMCLNLQQDSAIPIINSLWSHTNLKELMEKDIVYGE